MFTKEEIRPGIVIYKNIANAYLDFIKDLEEAIEAHPEDLKWGEPHIRKDNENVVDYNIRNLNTFSSPYLNDLVKSPETTREIFNFNLSQKLYDFMNPIEEDYKNIYGVKTRSHDSYQILKYGEGHFFNNHLDDDLYYPRTISTAWYINDNYDGGEINFPRFNLSYKPEANSMIVFPSNYVYNHSVNEVKNGIRYAVVSWLD